MSQAPIPPIQQIQKLKVSTPASPHSENEDVSREKALQTLVTGQQAENLLDFGDDGLADAAAAPLSGLAATTKLASTAPLSAANPLDDLVSIFGSTGMGAMGGGAGGMPMLSQGPPPLAGLGLGGGGGFQQPAKKVVQAQSDDLLGLF